MTGKQIREYRKSRGISQTELAKELTASLGVSYTKALISYIENGAVNPSKNIQRYIESKIAQKPVRTPSVASKGLGSINVSTEDISSLKSAILSKRRVTLADRVLGYMADFGSISSLEAFKELGVTRLSAVIFNLARDGYQIDRRTEHAVNRYGNPVHFTRYSLRKDDGKEDLDR